MDTTGRSVTKATPQRSAWLRTACPAPETASISEEIAVTYAVVGGGYAGLCAALRLAERGHACAVLEADEIGFGASGRNGGQVIPGLKYDPDELVRRFGDQRGERLARFAGEAATSTFAQIQRLGLACEARQCGWLQPAVDQQTLDVVAERARMWRAFSGVETRVLSRAETRTVTGTDFYQGSWIDPRGGELQPLSYSRELARIAISLGVMIFTHSPVTKLRREARQWVLTSRGRQIKADRIIVCTNGYSARLIPGLERASVPASSIMCATAPLPESLQREIMPDRLPISDARRLLTYMRYDSAGRFMIGARGSFGLHEPESYFRWLRATARRIYPQLADAAWEDAWGGRFALTVDHLPHIHQPDHGLFTAIGCNGRGIAMMSQIGGLLADLASGELSSDESPVPVTPLRTIPLHAFRRPALEAVGMWFGLQDRFSFLTPAPTGGR
jgi:glycine/D-amino acid oxidase-like deaminating enzyme